MKKKSNKKFIQKRMMLEKKWITYLSVVIIMLLFMWTFFTLSVLRWRIKDWSQVIVGLDEISTKEEIDKFYKSKYHSSILHFDFAIDTGEVVYIETTTQKETSLLGGTGGIVLQGPETIKVKEYNVYILSCKETPIVFCSSDENLDFSNGKIPIYNEYSGSYVNKEILEKYDNTGKGSVFYFNGNLKTEADNKIDGVLIIFGVYIILILPLIITKNSKFIHKRTKFGKKVSELGEFKILVKEINNEIDHAIYTYGNAVVTDKYVLLLKQVETEIIKIEEITDVEIIPDEKYPEEIIKVELECNNRVYDFNVYNKEDAEKIKDHITNKKAGN